MPLDARIPLTVNQPQPFDLGAVMDQAAKIEAAKLKRQQMIDSAADEAAIAKALQQNPNDPEAALESLSHRPTARFALQEQVIKWHKSNQELLKVDLDEKHRQIKFLSELAGSVTDEPSYRFARDVANKLYPDSAQMLPDQYDPARVQQLSELLLDSTQRANLRKQIADERFATDKDLQGDIETLAKYALTVQTPEEYAELLQKAPALGINRGAIAAMPPEMSAEGHAKLQMLAMGPAKIAELQNTATDNERQTQTAAETARHNAAMEARAAQGGATAPVSVIDPVTGKPVYVRPQDAYGKTPASSREQGRPVVSGDANRIADFDTSLVDMKALETAITETGTMSKIRAGMPNWINELTGGWGDDAKSRNAVIARVKQVIGKALEGGVLRKEDEEKYKEILPTIYDSKAVAQSKLEGLRTSITKRRVTLLDALEDAGYDVSRYRARTPADDTNRSQASNAYTGEVRQAADGRILGLVNGAVVELVKTATGYVVK